MINNKKACIIGLIADPERLADIRRNRVAIMRDHKIKDYTDLEFIKIAVEAIDEAHKKIIFALNSEISFVIVLTTLTPVAFFLSLL